jgi:hypothetical protein
MSLGKVADGFCPHSSWGTNGYKNFNCYKDNGHQLYRIDTIESSTTCNSIYYCVPQ